MKLTLRMQSTGSIKTLPPAFEKQGEMAGHYSLRFAVCRVRIAWDVVEKLRAAAGDTYRMEVLRNVNCQNVELRLVEQ